MTTISIQQSNSKGMLPALWERVQSVLSVGVPVGIIAGLLYAAFFIDPSVQIESVQPPAIEPRDAFFSAIMVGAGKVWALGSNGKIVRSGDNGETWSRQQTPVRRHLQSMAAWDAERAIAVGNDLTVLITQDGGTTWRQTEMPKVRGGRKLLRVGIAPDGSALAVGEFGTMVLSRDYGRTWTPVPTGEDISWNDAVSLGAGRWLVVGEFGHIRFTDDNGATWQKGESPVSSSLNGVAFRDTRNGVAVGTKGAAVSTSDGGVTWRAEDSGTERHLFDVIWDGNRWLAVGDRGVLLTRSATSPRWHDRSDLTDSGWRTQIAVRDGHYALAGRGIDIVELPEDEAVKVAR